MAAVVPITSSETAYGFTTPAGPKTATTEQLSSVVTPGHIEQCYFACSFSGTYVQGTGLSISYAILQSTIAGVKRDGGTITIIDVATAAPGLEGTTTPLFVMAGPVTFTTIGSGAATALIYGPDLATEHAATVMLAFTQPMVFSVTFASQQAV
jgi:hypothetical protein